MDSGLRGINVFLFAKKAAGILTAVFMPLQVSLPTVD
jgi:hypothetical protein